MKTARRGAITIEAAILFPIGCLFLLFIADLVLVGIVVSQTNQQLECIATLACQNASSCNETTLRSSLNIPPTTSLAIRVSQTGLQDANGEPIKLAYLTVSNRLLWASPIPGLPDHYSATTTIAIMNGRK